MRFSLPLAAAALAALAAVLLAALLAGGGKHAAPRSSAPSAFGGATLPSGLHAPDFTLTDQDGQKLSISSERGRILMLTFLSTSCGRRCIVLAQQIRGALDELGRAVPVLAVSTDPAADTPSRIARFLARVSLAGRVRYLTGAPAELSRIWGEYGIAAKDLRRVRLDDSTAMVILIDRYGLERVSFPLEQLTPEALAGETRALLAQG